MLHLIMASNVILNVCVCMNKHMCVCECMCLRTCIRLRVYVCLCDVCVCVCVCVCVQIHNLYTNALNAVILYSPVKSFIKMTKYLLSQSFLLSEHFCQDSLENYFGKQRARGRQLDNILSKSVYTECECYPCTALMHWS